MWLKRHLQPILEVRLVTTKSVAKKESETVSRWLKKEKKFLANWRWMKRRLAFLWTWLVQLCSYSSDSSTSTHAKRLTIQSIDTFLATIERWNTSIVWRSNEWARQYRFMKRVGDTWTIGSSRYESYRDISTLELGSKVTWHITRNKTECGLATLGAQKNQLRVILRCCRI